MIYVSGALRCLYMGRAGCMICINQRLSAYASRCILLSAHSQAKRPDQFLRSPGNRCVPSRGVEQNTTYAKLVAWASSDIPQPPYLFGIAKSYLYFRLRAIGGTNPPDPVPDPAITWTGMGPATLTITRYSSGPFGAWDQVIKCPFVCTCIPGPRSVC